MYITSHEENIKILTRKAFYFPIVDYFHNCGIKFKI